MLNCKTGSERQRLGFADAVQSAFKFLLEDYGFYLVRVESTYVRYESLSVFLIVYHGRASYELEVEIGQKVTAADQEERPFMIGELIELAGVQQETGYSCFSAHSPDAVKRFVEELAEYVKKYAARALKGDRVIFQALDELRSRNSESLMKAWNLKDVRAKADQAWKERDYFTLVKLYESIQADLTAAESKKLEYSKKRLP